MRTTVRRSLLPLGAALALAACEGRLGSRPGDNTNPAVRTDSGAPVADGAAPSDAATPALDAGEPMFPPFAPQAATLHRLTRAQFRNSVRELLGAAVNVPTDLELDTQLYGFATVGAASITVSPRAAEQFEAASYNVTAQVFNNPARRMALVGCAPGAADDACARGFIARFGRRAWRRPLEMAETERWVGVSRAAAGAYRDPNKGLEYVVAGMLQAPQFLFRVERGESVPSIPTMRRYTGYEMAARLSFLLWSSTPDDALLDAAGRGELDTAEGVRAQVRRLFADPRARTTLTAFFSEYFKLDRIGPQTRDRMLYPLYSPALVASMIQEFERIVGETAFGDGDLRDIFTTRTTFIDNNLARLYGIPGTFDATFRRYDWPANAPRAGVLTTAAFLTNNAHPVTTSPTHRGKFIRQFLLCQPIPPPPAGVTTDIPPPMPGVVQTFRQRLETLHLQPPACAACHTAMDPVGFGLEHYDAIGAYRTTDNTLPVDARGSLDGVDFRSGRELAEAVRNHRLLPGCIVRNMYRHATGHVEAESEAIVIRDVERAFSTQGYQFRVLIEALAASDGFRFAANGG
jgi:hypothetical protein